MKYILFLIFNFYIYKSMKIKLFRDLNENYSKSVDDKEYNEILGYDSNITEYLVKLYSLWTDVEGLPPLSADEQDLSKLTNEQKEFLSAFIKIWDITDNLECKYVMPYFMSALKKGYYIKK